MIRKTLTIVVLLLATSSLLFAGGTSEGSTADQTIKLKWQVWITPNLTRDFYNGAVESFTAQNPNIEIEIIEVSATASSGASDFLRNRIAAGDVPDVLSNLGDVPSFADAGHLWAMPLDDPDLDRVRDVEAALYNGKLYKIPQSVQPQSVVYYNKDLWAQAGLTEADIPTTMDELDAVCAQIKDAGLTPILTAGEWVPLVFFEYFLAPEITMHHPNLWTEVYNGDLKWTDPEFVEMLGILDSFVKKGYFNEGALSIGYAQIEQEFLSGNGVMYPMGSWYTAADANSDKDWETGCFAMPTLTGETNLVRSGGYGTSGAVAAASKNPEAAYKLVKFMVFDEEYGTKFIQADGLYSNLDPPLEYDMTQLQQDLADILANAEYSRSMFSHVLGDAAPPGVGDYFTRIGEAVLTQSYTSLKDLLATVDEFVAETR